MNLELMEFGLDPNKFRVKGTSKGYRVYSKELDKLPLREGDIIGILAMRKDGRPTSFFLRLVHQNAKKVEVSYDELIKLLKGEAIPSECKGWVLVSFNDVPIGRGKCKNGLSLDLPKAELQRIRQVLKLQ